MEPTQLATGHSNGMDKPQPVAQENLALTKTNDSYIVPRDLFEKIYLSPQNAVKGDLRKKLANPTPVCLLGFLIAASPLGCDLMGWRRAGNGAATIGAYYFFGGLLQILGSIGEFLFGNTFPCTVFACYGAFWLAFGAGLQPSFNAAAAYTDTGGQAQLETDTGFWLLFMTLTSLLFLICSIRTNLTFVFTFVNLTMAFGFLTGMYWNLALGNTHLAEKLKVGAGACVFILCMSTWYLFAAQMFLAVDLHLALPVGDLSGMIKGQEEKRTRQPEAV